MEKRGEGGAINKGDREQTYILKGFFFLFKSLVGIHQLFLSGIQVILQLVHLLLKITDLFLSLKLVIFISITKQQKYKVGGKGVRNQERTTTKAAKYHKKISSR